jgi:ABC-type glycerol-3-phosphate transport system substrate-binding protein
VTIQRVAGFANMLKIFIEHRTQKPQMSAIPRLQLMGALLICSCLILGCEKSGTQPKQSNLQGTINVLVSLDGAERFSKGKLEEQAALAEQMAIDYRYLNPGVHIEIEVTRESDLLQKVKSRTRDGLGPDLILARGWLAHRLNEEDLTELVQINQEYEKEINPGLLKRLRVRTNQYVGIPVFLLPQLACYNREKIARNPAKLEELMEASEQNIDIGMALDLADLFWTVGAWGGIAAEDAVLNRIATSQTERIALLDWLQSLMDASKNLKVNFYDEEEQLVEGLLNGRLDWITCRSSNIGRLRKHLGANLGVGTLPSGPEGKPTPITVSKVWAFGANSSKSQRELSSSFAHFTANAIMQRYTALITEQMLPANQSIPMPIGQSEVVSAMVRSANQSQQGGALVSILFTDQDFEYYKETTRAITEMIYGEQTPKQVRDLFLKGKRS